jgi:hypothetical protein
MLDIAKLKTQQHKLPRLDKAKYQSRAGLEGPFMTKAGQVVYYDKKKGQYYNPDNDMYLSYDDWKKLSEEVVESMLYLQKEYESSEFGYEALRDMKNVIDAAKKAGARIISQEKPSRGDPQASIEIETSNPSAVKAAINRADSEFQIDEDAPANATGTAVAGTGDDSSTVVVKKKKPLQDKLMKIMGIKEAIDRAVPDLEYPKDEITERKQQLIDLAKKHGENI